MDSRQGRPEFVSLFRATLATIESLLMCLRSLVLALIVFNLGGCLSPSVLRHFGGDKREIIGNGSAIYEFHGSFLVYGDVVDKNETKGHGYGLFPFKLSPSPQDEVKTGNKSSGANLYCKEAEAIIEGDLPKGAIELDDNGEYSYLFAGDKYFIFLRANPEANCSIPAKDGYVIKRKWYQWMYTGLLLLITGSIELFEILLLLAAHGGGGA